MKMKLKLIYSPDKYGMREAIDNGLPQNLHAVRCAAQKRCQWHSPSHDGTVTICWLARHHVPYRKFLCTSIVDSQPFAPFDNWQQQKNNSK